MTIKQFKTSILIAVLALFSACDGQSTEHNTSVSEILDQGIDNNLPIFMHNEANTTLHDKASADGKIVARLQQEDSQALICLSAVKDANNRLWYKCYYPSEQVEGWTYQVSHYDLQGDEKERLFLQNFSLAQLQLGANPRDAKRLLGKPHSEQSQEGPVEVSGYINEDDSVTTTALEFDGIRLVYADDRMIHAYLNKPGKRFGWITCGDKSNDKNALLKKFKLTADDIYVNDDGDQAITMGGFLALTVSFDSSEWVKSIEFNSGP